MTNYIPVNDPDMDHWAEVGRTSSDPEERVQAYAEMSKLIDENVYWVPLYTFKCAVIRNADLKALQSTICTTTTCLTGLGKEIAN